MVSVSVQISVAIVAVVQVAFSLTPLETFYPPNLNDTSYISNSSIGTYGGVYQASTNANESSPYGTYNYCTMPHPRV
jgi:acid phosphatase